MLCDPISALEIPTGVIGTYVIPLYNISYTVCIVAVSFDKMGRTNNFLIALDIVVLDVCYNLVVNANLFIFYVCRSK